MHASALAVLASVTLCSSIAQAETKAERPKLILSDLIGFGTGGLGGWLSYQHGVYENPRRELGPGFVQHGSKTTTSTLRIAPRFEVPIGAYLTLGGELSFTRYGNGNASVDDRYATSSQDKSYTFTAVPMIGLRLPLPRRLSIWSHVGFGGGIAVSQSKRTLPGAGSIDGDNEEALVTRFRGDVRLGYEPVSGLLFTLGPELAHQNIGGNPRLMTQQGTAIALFGAVSFVIR